MADALWELFCECKLRLLGDDTSYLDDDDGEDSRLSSATDDVSRSTLPVGDAISECLKVPVLKLKVGSSGGFVDSVSLSQTDCTNNIAVITPSNECSSDFDGASENQSMSTTQGRLSSCSEIDDQLTTEVCGYNVHCEFAFSAVSRKDVFVTLASFKLCVSLLTCMSVFICSFYFTNGMI